MRHLLLWLALAVASADIAASVFTWETIPLRNTDAQRFDAILVLGTPTEDDGTPTSAQRERVLEGVSEFKAGRASHVIMSGGAAHNRFVEAESMARIAEAAGVPAEDIEIEGRSINTIQNVYYSRIIMQAHGWNTVEVVSSPAHLPRASLILSHYNNLGLRWSTHPVPLHFDLGIWRLPLYYAREIQGTAILRWFGFTHSPFLPGS